MKKLREFMDSLQEDYIETLYQIAQSRLEKLGVNRELFYKLQKERTRVEYNHNVIVHFSDGSSVEFPISKWHQIVEVISDAHVKLYELLNICDLGVPL